MLFRSIDDVAVQEKPNEVRIGPMTRSRAKLLEQHVNSLLIEYDVCDYENFILPKSMHLCMIRLVDNTRIIGGEEQQGMENKVENIEAQVENIKHNMENMDNDLHKCSREEREAGAHGERHEGGAQHLVSAPKEEFY